MGWGRFDPPQVLLTYSEVILFYSAGLAAFLIVAGRRWIRPADPWDTALAVVPAILVVMHLFASAFVNMVPFHPEYFSLPLVAIAWGISRSAEAPRALSPHIRFAGTFFAVLFARDPMFFGRLTLCDGLVIYWSSMSVTLLVGAACQFVAAALSRDVASALYGIALLGFFVSTCEVRRLKGTVPDSAEGWGALMIAGAFVVLVVAIARTLRTSHANA